MSSYERYDETAAHYDRTRWPIGAEIIVGCLAQGGVPLADMTVLDAGCGTGNYLRALLPRVARIEALDRSAGMLKIAAPKLADAARTAAWSCNGARSKPCHSLMPRPTAS